MAYNGEVKEAIAVIAALLAIAGNVPYLIDIVKGTVRPHPYTWFIWTVVSATVFFGQVAKGAGVGALPTAASEIFTLLIFLFSLKYGFKNIPKSDTVYLIIALAGLIPWMLTKDPTLSVIIAVSIDAIAFIPTLRKAYREPSTESPLLFATNVVRHGLALFSLQAYNVATMLHSLVMICTNSAMVALLLRSRRQTTRV